ncbi:MAG: SDR family oxidoreductase, partial [Rhodospirillaceae bacterium]|nr:SDR family oxidoreductase [Rhodospirillaceae bacterium]
VPGAGGYVGIPLCRALLERGYHVVALDRFFFGRDKLAGLTGRPGFELLVDDIRFVDPALVRSVDAIIDLAGLSNDAAADLDPELTRQINAQGAMRLARAGKQAGVRRYVYSSSASVYGAGSKDLLTEEDDCHPQTEYARSKLAVENALKELHDDRFEIVLLRNATIFGLAPRMRFDLAINVMTLRAWKDKAVYVMGGGNQWRPFVHVSDVVRALILALEAPREVVDGQVFNVGHEDLNHRIIEIAQMVADVIPGITIHRLPEDADRRSYNLSFAKIRERLDFRPRMGVVDGIREIVGALEKGLVDGSDPTCYTVQWYKSLLDWDKRLKEISYKGVVL